MSRKPGPKVLQPGGAHPHRPEGRPPSSAYLCRPSAGWVGESGDAAGSVLEAEVPANASGANRSAQSPKTVTAGATVRKSPIAL